MTNVKGTHGELIAWVVLNMWTSHLGLPLLVGTVVLSKHVQRHAAFVSMCIIWIYGGLASSILVYSGHLTGPPPPKMLCLLQASLLYGIPPATSLATLVLVYQMFTTLKSGLQTGSEPKKSTLRTWLMVIVPYIALILTALATAIVGASDPKSISRDRRFFYCSVNASNLTNAIVLFGVANLAATLLFEVWTMVLLYRRGMYLRRTGASAKSPIDLAFAIRILAFGVYIILDLSLGVISIHAPESAVPDLAFATTATAVFFIFGSQRDIIRAWCFWRKERPKAVDKRNQPQEFIAK